jgi:hypothetical protein
VKRRVNIVVSFTNCGGGRCVALTKVSIWGLYESLINS